MWTTSNLYIQMMDAVEPSSETGIDSEDSQTDNQSIGHLYIQIMDAVEPSSETGIDSEDSQTNNQKISDALHELHIKNESLLYELEAIRSSYLSLQSKHTAKEEELVIVNQQKDEALNHIVDLAKSLTEASTERDDLRDELHRIKVSSGEREVDLLGKIDEEIREKEEIRSELEVSRERIEELLGERSEKVRVISENLESLRSVKECLVRVIESLDDNKPGSVVDEGEETKEASDLGEELRVFLVEVKVVLKFASAVESKLSEYQEMRKKEKRQLENSVVSLTEENRDINTLLRIALVEKEVVEKSLNRLKGNNEQKRVAILQIAERGLQKVGFGFMMGAGPAGTNEPSLDNSAASTGSKSDGSECEEEVVSLASTVERIMKNLRLEITQLRRSLEESRSDTERLQSLAEKQAQKLAENTMYIKELEDREMVLAQNVEELLMENKETEEEVARWRKACELEVEAGKNVIEDRDKVVAILRLELEKTKAALEISNGKLKLKEELAEAAMAAQAAAERSLQLADSRAAGLRERIEELTRQLEEAEKRERSNRRRVRHICWPWRALKLNPANSTNTTVRNVKQMLPEMQALLH